MNKFLKMGIIIVTLLVIAQSISYNQGSPFSISTQNDGGQIHYRVTAYHDIQCTEVHFNGNESAPRAYYLFYDESYCSNLSDKDMKCSEYLFSQEMSRCPGTTYRIADAEEIDDMIDASMTQGTFDIGLIFIGGVLPDCIYNGTSSSKIIQWMNAGGHVCWSGAQFGMFIATQSEVRCVENYESVCASLFGTETLFRSEGGELYANTPVNEELTHVSHLTFNDITYGIRNDALPPGSLLLGYTDGTYSSISIMRYGSGQIAIFGGYATFQNTFNLAHMISLSLAYDTEIVSSETCSIIDGNAEGTFDDMTGTSHAIILSDLKISRIWIYDGNSGKFI